MGFWPAFRRCDGFTLIEILIAAMMLSVLFTMLFVSYRQLVGDVQAVARKNTLTEMTATALHHVAADLKAAFVLRPPFYRVPGVDDSEPSPYRFKGTTTTSAGGTYADLRFVSGRHLDWQGTGAEGYAVIRYYVDDAGGKDGFRLRRQDQLVPLSVAPSSGVDADPVVCEHVSRFDVTYFDADGDSSTDWDSEAESFGYATPSAVGITLVVVGPDGETVTLATTVFMTDVRKAAGTDVQ